jgi:predicted transcriptional regulator
MTEESVDERELLWLLRSKVRRMIIEVVGDSGRIGAVALRDKLGISTGSLYYNLRQLPLRFYPKSQQRVPGGACYRCTPTMVDRQPKQTIFIG